jgi:hypothetical protein
MSQYVEGPTKSFIAGAAIAKHILVKVASGKIAVAGLAEEFIGSLEDASFADLDVRAVRLRGAGGTMKCTAAGAFSQGAVVYGRALGKIDDVSTSSAVRVGIALEAATAAGDIVEVLVC